jgi:hypothetical protein
MVFNAKLEAFVLNPKGLEKFTWIKSGVVVKKNFQRLKGIFNFQLPKK